MIKVVVSIFVLFSLYVSADFIVKDGRVEYIKKKKIPLKEQYTKECDGGSMVGCSNLALLYFTGDGLKENHNKTVELFARACKKKHSKACYHLGAIYKRGTKYRDGSNAIRKDIGKAKVFYAKGCMYGYAQSCDQYDMIKDKKSALDSDIDFRLQRYNIDAYGG